MIGDKKGDIINRAYSALRISGLTVQPTPEDNELALAELEAMMQEFYGRNICVAYNFEDSPNINTPSGVSHKFWTALKNCLAYRLMPDFGKGSEPDPILIGAARSGFSFLSSSTALVRETEYPTRQPIGSGNTLRWARYRTYYRPVAEAPLECATNHMIVDDIDDFVEHFDSYLQAGETISSYTLEADTGLTIVSESLSTPDVNYRIQADGNTGSNADAVFQVKIVATTSDNRVTTRLINFELKTVEICNT